MYAPVVLYNTIPIENALVLSFNFTIFVLYLNRFIQYNDGSDVNNNNFWSKNITSEENLQRCKSVAHCTVN